MIGQTLSHYKILEQLGQGGMGVVYKAQDTRLLRHVAVKILATELMGDEKRRQRFIKEAQTASSLNHPNICTIHDIDEAESAHFIVMEFIEGETLRERLKRLGPLPEAEVIDLALKVCDALAAVHEKGIFHRDVKPDNIMISSQRFVKVMDFGLAKLATDAAEAIAEPEWRQRLLAANAPARRQSYVEDVVLTNLSGLLGTVHYMSPEQAQGKTIDHRSDIFSLGVTLYELLTGQRPFEGESNLTILSKIINDPPLPIALDWAPVSRELQQLMSRCVAKEPAQRFQSVHEIIMDLRLLAQANLTVQEKKRVSQTVTIKPEAYDDYLKGAFYFDNFTPMNLLKSQECFQNAIDKAPEYAPAYIGLAQTFTHLGIVGWLPPHQAAPAARAAAAKALALDETLADAHAVLGLAKLAFEWDWPGADDAVNLALKLNPHSVVAHDVFSFYWSLLGQHENSLPHLKHNLDAHPSSFYHNVRLGWSYYAARKYDEAIAQLRKTQEMYPELNLTHSFLAWAYTKKGLHDEALAECAKAQAKGAFDWQFGRIYAGAGKILEAQNALHAILSQNIPAHAWIAEIYLALGDLDHAFEYFEKAWENGSPEITQLKVAPQWDGLRSDPRYFALLKKIGLESYEPNRNAGIQPNVTNFQKRQNN